MNKELSRFLAHKLNLCKNSNAICDCFSGAFFQKTRDNSVCKAKTRKYVA